METRILHSIRRFRHFTEVCLLFAFAVATAEGHAEVASKGVVQTRRSPVQITEWEDGVSGGLNFLHQLFPDTNPGSKEIILNNENWGHYSGGPLPKGLLSFAIFVCQPDLSPSEEQRQDLLNRYKLHCSVLTMFADILLSSSQLGKVPSHINIGRPALDKRWSELSAVLLAHPKWSPAQVEQAMQAAGVKYGKNGHDEVLGPIEDSVKKLEPFLGKLTIDSIDYSPPSQLLSSNKLSPPVWRVEAHPSGQDKRKPWTTYVLIFSAFDGAFESEHSFLKVLKPSESR